MTLKFSKKHLGLAALASCGLLTACNSGGNNNGVTSSNQTATNAKQSHRLGLSDDFFAMQLGSPIETSNNSVTSSQSCLAASANPDNITASNPSGMLNLANSNLSQLQNVLGIDVSSPIGSGRWNNSVAGQFVKNAKDTAYSRNLIYVLYQYGSTLQFKNEALGFGNSALTPSSLTAFNVNSSNFRAQCGDNFIAQIDAGIIIAVTIKLNFSSSYAATKFMQRLQLQNSFNFVLSQIQTNAISQNANIAVQLNALQMGGIPSELNRIFNSDGSEFSSIDCGNAATSTNESYQICEKKINTTIGYLQQSVESQVHYTNGKLNLNNLYFYNPVQQSYSFIGINLQAPDPSESQLQAMKWLTTTYDTLYNEQNLLDHYINRIGNKFAPNAYSDLLDANQRLKNQIQEGFDKNLPSLSSCFKGYVTNQCTNVAAKISQMLINPETALTSGESDLTNNLMSGAYLATLYNFFPLTGNSMPPENESQGIFKLVNSDCTLIPISYSKDSEFILQCNGQILNTANGNPIFASINPDKNTLTVSNLDYLATIFDPSISLFMPDINYGLITANRVTGGFYSSNFTIQAGSQIINNAIAEFGSLPNQYNFGI